MMEPRIQYAKTEDGVSIAYYVLGDGYPLLSVWYPSHLQSELREESSRKNLEGFRDWKLVRFDGRGFGLSDRNVSEFTVEALASDLSAVADHLELGTFGLYSAGMAAPVAIYFAANHPERVSRLALWLGNAKGSETWTEQIEAIVNVAEKDWEFARESITGLISGYSRDALPEQFVRQMKEATDAKSFVSFIRQARDWDVSDLLGSLTMPTLVAHAREYRNLSIDSARSLAASIPNAQLLLQEGSSVWMDREQAESLLATFRELGDADDVAERSESVPSGLVTILFTDIESSTALTQSLGDAKAQDLIRTHNTIVRDALKAHGGSEIKHTGDGIMASFPTASSALDCAISIQQGVAKHKEEDPDSPLAVYIGVNAGEPVAEEDDLFGASVQLARRICDHAEPGQILASNVVRELATGKGFLFGDIGDVVPKGFEEPVRLYEVRWEE